MGKYHINIAGGQDNWCIFDESERIVTVVGELQSRAIYFCKILNEETASLQADLATTRLALETCQQELAKRDSFIRGMKEFMAKANLGSPEQKLEYLAQELASWDSKEAEESETKDRTIVEYGIVHYLQQLVTRNKEVMATFTINGRTVVAFPKTWAMHKDKVMAQWDNRTEAITCVLLPDDSRAGTEYILQAVNLNEESESGE